jgi:hypothetical protein
MTRVHDRILPVPIARKSPSTMRVTRAWDSAQAYPATRYRAKLSYRVALPHGVTTHLPIWMARPEAANLPLLTETGIALAGVTSARSSAE